MKTKETHNDKVGLEKKWNDRESNKSILHSKSELYSGYTLPYLYPRDETRTEGDELPSELDSIGARAVNHLSNRLIDTLFPSTRSFVKYDLDKRMIAEFKAKGIPEDAVSSALVNAEKSGLRLLDLSNHRTAATMAAKLLIVTGNGLLYYPDKDGKKQSAVQVYSTRDYSVVRDLSGEVIEIITRDCKAFETFATEVQDKLRTSKKAKQKKYTDATNVTVYTLIELQDDGKFHIKQQADDVELDINGDNTYAAEDLPWIPLVWNLTRGDNYGRGMVEDYRGAFGAISVLTQALIEGVISAAAVKYLVNPGSVIDIEHLNKSKNGTYHAGRDGDVVAIKSDKHLDFEQVRIAIAEYQRQIGQAFLLNSDVTRDAERVTAEEIRRQALELETSYGGIYSRFSADWQKKVANILLKRLNLKIENTAIFPVITTGLDTLSRLGELDNYRLLMEDLSIIAALPDEIRPYIKVGALITFAGNNRGVDYSMFIKTEDEMKAEQAALMEQQKQAMAAEASSNMLQDASKEIVKQDE